MWFLFHEQFVLSCYMSLHFQNEIYFFIIIQNSILTNFLEKLKDCHLESQMYQFTRPNSEAATMYKLWLKSLNMRTGQYLESKVLLCLSSLYSWFMKLVYLSGPLILCIAHEREKCPHSVNWSCSYRPKCLLVQITLICFE